MKTFHFLSGLPRSGSTALAALLNQNPRLHVSGTSAISSVMTSIWNCWKSQAEFSALGPLSEIKKKTSLSGLLNGFYADVEQDVIIDKDRAWPFKLEMAEAVLGYKPKIIATVRDVRDVLASFERLWRKAKINGIIPPPEAANSEEYLTVEGRCRTLMRPNGLVGSPVLMLRDAILRGWRDQILFVEYEPFCKNPFRALSNIYQFLGLEPFEGHDPGHIEQTTQYDDLPHGWGEGLHSIRGCIEENTAEWEEMIPPHVAMQYAEDALFWRKL